MGELWRRLQFLLHRKQMEQDLAEEMRLHLEMRAEEEDAAAARRRFGNVTQLHEAGRSVWGWTRLETLVQDLRYGLRNLAVNPGFTATAVLSLALGIGANTAIFSILNAVMLRSLPVKDPHQLVHLESGTQLYFTNPIWEQVRDHQKAFSGALAYSPNRFDLTTGGESHFADGLWVSGDFFNVLGVPAMRGRMFDTSDDRHGGGRSGPVAVISARFWKAHCSSDPNVVGKTIQLDRHPFTIVGVTPPWFTGLETDHQFEVAIPIGCEPILHTDRSALGARSWWWLRMQGRLNAGESLAQATDKLNSIAPELFKATLPPNWDPEGKQKYLKRSFKLSPAAQGFSETATDYRTALFTLMAVVGLVLLIACANIANLLLARASARQREISVRLAIGAGRGRVIRQLLTESLLLSGLGAAGGLLFAAWGSQLLVRFLSKTGQELRIDVAPDFTVLAFAAGAAILTGLLFGLAPALRATRIAPHQILKEHARGTVGGRFQLGNALVSGQVAISLVLLVAAGLFAATLRNLLKTDLGFQTHNVLLIDAGMMRAHIAKERRTQFYREGVEALRHIPGVVSASDSAMAPISGYYWNDNVYPEGYTPKGPDDNVIYFNRVSPGYFTTLRTPLLLGRDFNEHDNLSAPKVIILNESAARHFFEKANPLGKTIGIEIPEQRPKRDLYQVIGVSKDAKYGTVSEPAPPAGFVAQDQDSDASERVVFEVRSEGRAAGLIPAATAAMLRVNPGISLEFRDFERQVSESLLQPRMVALLSGFFGGLALLLAMIGLYGVTAYGVARRQSEIGIRMALGAQTGAVVWLVVRDVFLMLALGTAVGVAASLAAGRLVTTLLYGVKFNDAAQLVTAAAALGGATAIAAYLPARRAARLDPMVALREE